MGDLREVVRVLAVLSVFPPEKGAKPTSISNILLDVSLCVSQIPAKTRRAPNRTTFVYFNRGIWGQRLPDV